MWGRLDDHFHDDPKTIRVGLAANGLFARAVSYCADHETDGVIPVDWVTAQLVGETKTAGQRILAVMFEAVIFEHQENGGGYLVHDYLDYNPSRAQIASKRARDSQRKSGAS